MNGKKWIALIGLCTAVFFTACQKDNSSSGSGGSITVANSAYSVASELAVNAATHDASTDFVWDAGSEQNIVLNVDAITTSSAAVTISGTTATITTAGNFHITGTLTNGQIKVETSDADPVRLVLDGVNITNATGPAMYIAAATKTVVVLQSGTQNTLTDGAGYAFATGEDEPNATLFSKDDLSIGGTGALTVNAQYADAITSKDGLIIANGNITVTAKDDGIRGKDYLVVEQGKLTINAVGDALKSDNDTDLTLGFVHVVNGTFILTSGADAVQAATDVLLENGSFSIISGGGSSSTQSFNTAKGLKAGKLVVVDAGTFSLNTADDAIHSNNNLCLNAGTFTIASKDDGMHADTTLVINGGDITISKSYEGIESQAIIINGGSIHLSSSDDGLNAAGGNDGSAGGNFPGASSSTSSDYYIVINGGYIWINATGDGVDANGAIEMTNGVVLVNGPTAQNNGPVDYDGGFKMTGGTLVAVGSAGMAQAPDENSTQNGVLVRFGSSKSAGTLIHIRASDGEEILTFQPAKSYQSLVYASPNLKEGTSYTVFTGGSSSGTVTDGLYSGGSYTAGNSEGSFKVSGVTNTMD